MKSRVDGAHVLHTHNDSVEGLSLNGAKIDFFLRLYSSQFSSICQKR